MTSFLACILSVSRLNPARLTAHDWLGTNAQVPWNQRHIRSLELESDGVHKGYWWVDIAEAGNYQFELRRWPAEANLPITAAARSESDVPGVAAFRTAPGVPFSAATARLQVHNTSLELPFGKSDTHVTFSTKVAAGKTKLVATFADAAGNEVGAYYVTVTVTWPNGDRERSIDLSTVKLLQDESGS